MEVLAVRWLVPRDVEWCTDFSTEKFADLDTPSSDSNVSITHEFGPQQIRLPFVMRAGVGQVVEYLSARTFDNDRSRNNRHDRIVPWSIEMFTD